jgi:hypothetical protein
MLRMGQLPLSVCILTLSLTSFGQPQPSICAPFTNRQECSLPKSDQAPRDFINGKRELPPRGLGQNTTIFETLRPRGSNYVNPSFTLLAPAPPYKTGFQWKRALFESFTFFSIEQTYLVHKEYHWVTAENGVPFNHYWNDYTHSLSTWAHSGWDDGDPFLDNYIGHPIQGALTGYIQVQNDPLAEKLEFSNSKAYWRSRLKAMLWNAAYSTQWEIGPLSEMTIEKYGTAKRGKWNPNGTYPCTSRHCVNGTGKVDLVITPIGGLGWMVTEDVLDKQIAKRVEGLTRNGFLIAVIRCAVNPIRGGANILHGKLPWYRASRDGINDGTNLLWRSRT